MRTHEAGQVFGLGAEAVNEPRAHAGRPEMVVPVFMKVWRRIVVDRLGVHRADDADVVGDGANVRKDLRDLLAGFAEPPKPMLRPEAAQSLPLELRDRLPVVKEAGIGCPSICRSLGLKSKVSRCDGPPAM